MNNVTDKFAPLRKGLLEFAVISIIANNKVYAADILARLQKTDFAVGEGTLYPLLSRLRRDKLVDYHWVESESGPPRKYYTLTETGEKHRHELTTYWKKINHTLKALGE